VVKQPAVAICTNTENIHKSLSKEDFQHLHNDGPDHYSGIHIHLVYSISLNSLKLRSYIGVVNIANGLDYKVARFGGFLYIASIRNSISIHVHINVSLNIGYRSVLVSPDQ